MTIRKEDREQVLPTSETERDADLHLLAAVKSGLGIFPDIQLVVTGSYAIEALTGIRLYHNDIDVNIFMPSLAQGLDRARAVIREIKTGRGQLALYKQTDDRLEFVAGTNRMFEAQFIEGTRSKDEPMEFVVRGEGRSYKIPTTPISLRDSEGREYQFQVKSLAYAIATWSIRASGLASYQKRELCGSDLDCLAGLLTLKYDHAEVLSAMKHHPQMPSGLTEDEVFAKSLAALGDHLNR